MRDFAEHRRKHKTQNMKTLNSKFFKKILLTIFLLSVMTSCQMNRTYQNRDEDKIEGEKFVNHFFELLKNKNYDETYKMYSPKFIAITNQEKIKEIYDFSFGKLGEIEDINIERWETIRVEGSNPLSSYAYIYNVKRSKYASIETFKLEKEGNEIKILSYNVNYDVTKVK